ncbi:aldo/keto reductase [Streptomyces hainanensis]|uniref:Aldo/keto reductase n=1 Tax=Streptomyces hainanensis TaxID=402648 RepID=A0A4R4T0C0_9ACTN|nr:aldo/keto reductase [Streptomyces hainanensis]
MQVSPITLGTSFLGNPPTPDGAPAPAADELASALLGGPYAAVDTSNNYAQGRSETVLGRELRANGLGRGRSVITKVDADPETGALDRDRVWRSFEESTARLGLSRLPVLHLHDPYTVTADEALAPGGAVQGLRELREQGLVAAIGIAAGPLSLMTRYVRSGAFDALLTHNRYTLVDRSAEPLIAEATERGMGVFNAAPFGGGLLAGRTTRYAYRDSPPDLLAWIERARLTCQAHGVDLPVAALHFSLRNPLVHSTVVGVNASRRIADLERMRTTSVPEALWTALAELGTPPSTIDD